MSAGCYASMCRIYKKKETGPHSDPHKAASHCIHLFPLHWQSHFKQGLHTSSSRLNELER